MPDQSKVGLGIKKKEACFLFAKNAAKIGEKRKEEGDVTGNLRGVGWVGS